MWGKLLLILPENETKTLCVGNENEKYLRKVRKLIKNGAENKWNDIFIDPLDGRLHRRGQ